MPSLVALDEEMALSVGRARVRKVNDPFHVHVFVDIGARIGGNEARRKHQRKTRGEEPRERKMPAPHRRIVPQSALCRNFPKKE
jgi:hypothetical protein